MVVIIGVTLFAYQVTDRIIVYCQRNTNVDVAVKYVPSVEFPSVTICNQNQFRYLFHIQVQLSQTMDLSFLVFHKLDRNGSVGKKTISSGD